VGNGVLHDQMDRLMADGWDDVPTLKMMTKDDMDTLQLSQLQRDALEIRTYLHDHLLMDYADTLEASGKTLSELLSTPPAELTRDYKMKRGHVARFLDRGSACAIQLPKDLVLPARKVTAAHHGGAPLSPPKKRPTSPPRMTTPPDSGIKMVTSTQETTSSKPPVVHQAAIFSAPSVTPRLCGLLQPGGLKEEVSSLGSLENIMIRKIAPQHSKGVNPFAGKGPIHMPEPTRASELWAEKPTLILCLRRPGCVMCRAEAHQLYSRKPIFDAMGIQLVAVINEHIDAEVRAFWPRYWGGAVVVDEDREFFKALGQGELPKEGFVTGFLLNAAAKANYKRAKATGVEGNYNGEGTIKGGLYIMRPGNGGVAYQFIERNFGDWAPLEEVLEVCGNLSKR